MREKLAKALTPICNKLGESNKPIIAVATIATFKAIMRPLYSLSNKEEPKKTRYYAAARDFTTEAIAIPSYIGLSWAAEKYAHKLAFLEDVEGFAKKQKIENVKDVVGFAAICGAATFVIPALCNALMPHAMKIVKKFEKKQETQAPQVKKLDVSVGKTAEIASNPVINKPGNGVNQKFNLWKQSISMNTSGMRVGS